MTDTAIIVVNWNGKKYLQACLDSLRKQTYKNFDIYLVDNNSTDGSLRVIKNYKNLKLIKNTENFGFARGNNTGIIEALKKNYNYITLLNYDTETDPRWLESLVTTLKMKENCAACQSLILIDKTNLINSSGNLLHYLGFSYCGGYKEKYISKKIESKDLPLISGASCIFRAQALKESGLFDEEFFMYHEDVDLSWRLRELGYSFELVPESIVYHKYSFSRNPQKMYLSEKNRLIFMLKNYQLKTLLLLLPALLITEILMIFYSLFTGWFIYKIKGYGSIIRAIPDIRNKRRNIQSKRKIKDCDLTKYLSTELKYEEISSPLFVPLNIFYNLYWVLVKRLI